MCEVGRVDAACAPLSLIDGFLRRAEVDMEHDGRGVGIFPRLGTIAVPAMDEDRRVPVFVFHIGNGPSSMISSSIMRSSIASCSVRP